MLTSQFNYVSTTSTTSISIQCCYLVGFRFYIMNLFREITKWKCSSQNQSHIATDDQSVCLPWCRTPAGAHDQRFLLIWKLLSCPCGAPSLTIGRVCHLSVIVCSINPLSFVQLFTILLLKPNRMYNIYRPLSVQAQYSKLCPISSSIR
jgi:hypothetical protein